MIKIRILVSTLSRFTPKSCPTYFASCQPLLLLKSMLSRYPLPTLIVLRVCTLLTSLLPVFAASLSNSHDQRVHLQAQPGRHAGIPGAGREALQHQHDDSSIDESRAGHQHGHSPVDHIHEPLFAPPVHALVFYAGASQRGLRDGTRRPGAFVATLERPPKPITA